MCIIDKDLNMYTGHIYMDFTRHMHVYHDVFQNLDKCLDGGHYIEGKLVSTDNGIMYNNVVDADIYEGNSETFYIK